MWKITKINGCMILIFGNRLEMGLHNHKDNLEFLSKNKDDM